MNTLEKTKDILRLKDHDLDQLEALEIEVIKLRLEDEAKKKIDLATVRLIRGNISDDTKNRSTSAFYCVMAMKLEYTPSWEIDTMCTNGTWVKYNPEFTCAMSTEQVTAVICHEVLHCAHEHHCRMQKRETKRWNVATDLEINSLLKDAKFELPDGCVLPTKDIFADLPREKSAEWYYANITQEQEDQCSQGPGDVVSAGDPSQTQQQKDAWQKNLDQARNTAQQVAKQYGEDSAGLERFCESLKPKVNWQAIMRQFVNSHARNDYSWVQPNRRYVWQGLYLPGVYSEEMGHIVCAVDCSGSIGQAELNQFAGEIMDLASIAKSKVTVVYHDTEVAHVQTWTQTDGPLKLTPHGGGGTDHCPTFDWIEKNAPDAVCVVAFTDMYSRFPDRCSRPTLWACTSDVDEVPFGRMVKIQ